MSWIQYYKIIQKTGGEIIKADPKEMVAAARGNPNSPSEALTVAFKKYEEDPNLKF